MDSLTAGITLIIVQFCIAVVMTGVYFTARGEKCTGYWTLSSCVLAAAISIAIINNQAFNPLIILLAAACFVAGAILQWHGILVFYKQEVKARNWLLLAAMMLILSVALYFGANPQQRLVVVIPFIVTILALSLRTVWIGQQGWPRTFSQGLVPVAILVLLCNNLLRLCIIGMQLAGLISMQPSTLEVAVAFIIPSAGIIIFSIGLLLLYFERMVDENHHLATHDELSRLLNRRAIDSRGERELEMAVRLQRHLAVAYIDIDMFKHFNDRFGHASGDMIITDVASILQETCRTIDLVGRYGGEEFLIVLPGASREDAATIGQRLVEAMHCYHFLGIHPVTISVGLATLPNETCTWDQLIRRADAALYEAKNLGRNRYCV